MDKKTKPVIKDNLRSFINELPIELSKEQKSKFLKLYKQSVNEAADEEAVDLSSEGRIYSLCRLIFTSVLRLTKQSPIQSYFMIMYAFGFLSLALLFKKSAYATGY